MAWASKDTSTQLTSISTEQFFDDTPALAPRETAHCQITITSSGSTDTAIVNVYSTLDATSENWDTVPIMAFEVPAGASGYDLSFLVTGVYKFRIGVVRETGGSTDTFTGDLGYRLDGVGT